MDDIVILFAFGAVLNMEEGFKLYVDVGEDMVVDVESDFGC